MNKKIFVVLLLGLFMIGLGSANLNDDIVSYYKLDNSSGVVYDVLRLNDGANNGAIRGVVGKINNSFSFDNSGDDLTIADSSSLDLEKITISTWINQNNQVYKRILGKGSNYILEVSPDSTNGRVYLSGNPGGSFKAMATSNTTVPINTWVHVVATYDGTTARIYQDGVLTAVNSPVGGDMVGVSDIMYIGNNPPNNRYFNGEIDELGFWNRSINVSEVQELYNSGNGTSYPFPSEGSNPIINLISPENNSKQTSSIINITSNVTINTGFNHSNQTLYIWNENGSLFYSNTKTEDYNLTVDLIWSTSGFEIGMDYTWNIFACGNDSICDWADENYTFTSSAFSEYLVTYENSVIETDNKQFNLTINSTGVDEVSSTFWYNGTSYAALVIDLNDGNYKAVRSIDIPLQNNVGNKSFHWQFDFILTNQNELQQNSTKYSQEVNRTFFQLCNETYPVEFVNFTTRDAENPFPLQTASFKSAWTWHVTTGTGTVLRNLSYEDVTETKSNFKFCASPNITFNVNADLEIDAIGFAQNYYYLIDSQLSNGNENINLYLLNDSLATPTTLQVKDKFQNPIEGMLIHIQLYDVGTDTLYTVGMARTNNNGEDNAYLNWYDSLYKFILIQDGSTILETNVTKVFETPKKFEIPDVTTYSFDKFQDFEYSLIFNELTNIYSLTYVKPSGEVEQGCLRVIKRTSIQDTQVCLTCSSSTSSTLFCDISSAGNGTFIAAFYATGSWFMIDWVDNVIGESFATSINNLLDKDDAAFYSILLAGVVVSVFLFNVVLGIIGIILGLLAAGALGFTVLSYSIYIGIVLIGGVIIWLIKR